MADPGKGWIEMTMDQLEMLEMIVEKGSFKAASEALHKTQPSLSVAIKKLEEEYGITLFNREDYRPKLTDQGRIFYLQAKQALSSFRSLDVTAKELGFKSVEPQLTIVVDPLVRYAVIEGLFEECSNENVATQLTLQCEILDRGVHMLLAGEADFAIGSKSIEYDEIESHPFEKIEMLPVVSKKTATPQDLGNLEVFRKKPQIFVVQNRDQIQDGRRSVKPTISHGQICFVTDHAMKTQLIKEGFGWGRLALHEIKDDLKKGRLMKLKPEVARGTVIDLHVMRCRNKPLGPIGKRIWDGLRKKVF